MIYNGLSDITVEVDKRVEKKLSIALKNHFPVKYNNITVLEMSLFSKMRISSYRFVVYSLLFFKLA